MSSIANAIVMAAQAAGIDPKLALEVATTESGLNPNAVGAAGEIGLFQLLPSSFPGVNLWDVNTNIQTGVGYLAQLLSKYQDPAAALAAYNWGAGSAQKPRLDAVLATYGSDWFNHIPSSTQAYINKILSNVQTQYAASVGPIPMPAAFMPGSQTPGFVPPAPAPSSGMSIWSQVAIAVAVIFGVSLLLSDS